MAFDAHKNLAIGTVATAPGVAGTSLTVGAGEGARFPAAPFNVTVWAADMAPDPTTAEVARVTARAGDVFTLLRAQEGTTARAIVVGDLIAATITAKSLTDIESGVNFPLITTPGDLTFTSPVNTVRMNTADGADSGVLLLTGGGAADSTRGGQVRLYGNEAAQGVIQIHAGNAGRGIEWFTGGAERGRMHPGGGFSWGSTVDPGAGNVGVGGNIVIESVSGLNKVRLATPDGADTGRIAVCGGGDQGNHRGSYVSFFGNESGGAGKIDFIAGDVVGGTINFSTTGGGGTIHRSGGFSWGGTTDPGAGVWRVGPGTGYTEINTLGDTVSYRPATTSTFHTYYYNANGICGGISTNGAATQYNTASDARLKTPLSRHTDPSVLRNTVIHNFVWKSDGTTGRGVFAQEAAEVAPFAVSVGSDEVDESGRLTHPWGVDYSKYVPDLIVGWQRHEGELLGLEDTMEEHADRLLDQRTEIAALTARLEALETRPSLLQWIREWITAWVFPKESPCV